MYTTIQKWGNSQAVRIPRSIMEQAELRENDRVEIVADGDSISIRKVPRKYASLGQLFEGYQGNYRCKEANTGLPVGKEV